MAVQREISENEKNLNLTKITKIIGPLIGEAANRVATEHFTTLATKPVDYIIPAVWGVKHNGELDAAQEQINRQINPVIQAAIDELQLKSISKSQEFAVEFLIREVFISKIAFLLEMAKNLAANQINFIEQYSQSIEQLEPLGNA